LFEENMTDETETFIWPEPGESWWMRAGASVGASEKQVRFAAAKRRGCSNTQAARESGFGSTPASLRAEGWRVSKSPKISQLLALCAAEVGGGFNGDLTQTEAKSILSGMARGSDPNVRIKAIESLGKIQAAEREERSNEDEGDPHTWPERTARAFLSCCPPERVPILWAELTLMMHHWHAPWIKDMTPYLNAHHRDHWDSAKKAYLIGEYGQMTDNVAKLERGEVLPLEELLRRCGIEPHAEKPRVRVEEEEHAAA
jgi:hypothetical protein